ncbi:MAG: sigma-70 family RNA polymerase sigma factor [Planctomycetota bacterium]
MTATLDSSPKPKTPTMLASDASSAVNAPRYRSRVLSAACSELWNSYAAAPTAEHRNALVEHYQPFAREVVRRFAARLPKSVDRGDLEAASNLGLMSAIASFDPERNIRFEAYADLRVRGALLDELRVEDWLPRPWRQRVEDQKRTHERLRNRLGREPRDDEVADAMELTVLDYQLYFGVGLPGSRVGAQTDFGDRTSLLDVVADERTAAPDAELTKRELLSLVTHRLSTLEIRIVYLKYWEDLPMREIGELTALSESRVCKIHTALLRRLRSLFRVDLAIDES